MSDELTLKVAMDKAIASAKLKELNAELKAMQKAALTDAEIAKKAETDMLLKQYRKRLADAKKALNAEEEEAKKVAAAHDKLNENILAGVKSIGSFAIATVGLDSVGTVISSITEHFREAKQAVYDAGKMVTDYRESLLELAALKGKLGDTGGALKDEVQFRSKTLQSAEDARQFQLAALGVGASTIDTKDREGLISQEEFNKSMVAGGRFQAVEKGSAETHGTLTGLIPSLIGRRTDASEVQRFEKQLYDIFQPGGASFSSMTNQYAKLAPLAVTGQFDAKQMAGLLSAFSISNKEGAGENVQQFSRATIGSLGRSGKGRVEGGEAIDDYFKKIGVTEKAMQAVKASDQPFVIADAIVEDLDRQAADAAAKGQSFGELAYLRKHGFQNQDDVNALLQYKGLKQTGQLGSIMDLANKDLPSVAEAEGPLQAATQDPVLVRRAADLAEEQSKIVAGSGKEEFMRDLMKTAFARLKVKGEVSGEFDESVTNPSMFSSSELLFGKSNKTKIEAQKILEEEANRLGIGTKKSISNVTQTTLAGTQSTMDATRYHGDDYLYGLRQQIAEKGGDVLPGRDLLNQAVDKALDSEKIVKAVDRLNTTVQAGQGRAAPRPLVGAPPQLRR
jgi:hypothetical protein